MERKAAEGMLQLGLIKEILRTMCLIIYMKRKFLFNDCYAWQYNKLIVDTLL